MPQKRTHVTKGDKVRTYWRVQYFDPDGRRRSKTFARKADAERFEASVITDKSRGLFIDPADGRRLFRDVAEAWRAGRIHRPSTVDQVDSHLRNHILPALGDRPISAIRPSEVQGWVRDRSEVLAPTTLKVVYRLLGSIFKTAVTDRLIPASPCVGIRLPRIEKPRVVPLPTDAVEALINAMPERYRALVVLAAGTGLRQGEVFGLTADHVDFLRRQLTVEQQLITLPGQPQYLGPPKTTASRRTVPLPDVVLEALSLHMARYPLGPWGLLFTNSQGAPINRRRFNGLWRRTADSVGISEDRTFHDLRHFYASLLISKGLSVKVVQARLGHASAMETLDTYSHLWPDDEDLTRSAIDAVLGNSGMMGVGAGTNFAPTATAEA